MMSGLRFALLFIVLTSLATEANSQRFPSDLSLLLQRPRPRQVDKGGRMPAKIDLPSPYTIERVIDINDRIDLNQIWQMLSIAPPNGESYQCNGDCEAETFDLPMADSFQRKTVALRLAREAGHFYQYLIFRQTGSESGQPGAWKLLGNVDCFEQQTAPPAHRIERGDSRTWLVIKTLWGQGAGRIAYGETWYEIQEDELRRVLAYPVAGHSEPCRGQLGRSYKTFLLRHDLDNGIYTIPVQFMIAYDISDCDRRDASLSLFAKGQKAYFVWNADKEQFVLDDARSEITEKQLNSFNGSPTFSQEAFVTDNFSELSAIARGNDVTRKAWLKDFLTHLQDTPRRNDLQRLLQQ